MDVYVATIDHKQFGRVTADVVELSEYQQLMEQAVRFAEAYRKAHLSNWIDLHMATKDPVYVEAQAFLKEREGT